MNTINQKILSFLSNDTLENIKKELEYYLPELIAENLQSDYCNAVVAVNQELADENRQVK